MALITVRPFSGGSFISQYTFFEGGGNVLGDANDGTGVGMDQPGAVFVVAIAGVGLQAGQRIASVTPYARIFGNGTNSSFFLTVPTGSGPVRQAGIYGGGTVAGTVMGSAPNGLEWGQNDVNNMKIQANENSSVDPIFKDVWCVVDVRTPSSITPTGPVGNNPGATRTPEATWVRADNDGQGQLAAQVKVYRLDTATSSGFNPDSTSGAVYDSGRLQTGSLNHTIPTSLPDGAYRMYVRSSKEFRGGDWWTAWSYTSFTINDTPQFPTEVTPQSSSTFATDFPTLTARLNTSPLSTPSRVTWQIATDTAFSANVRTVTSSGYQVNGLVSASLSQAQRLTQNTWYLRARTEDNTGKQSGWTNTQYFTVSHPPAAANLLPGGDQTLNYGSTSGQLAFTWDFTDPAPEGDSQTAFQVIVERNDSGSLVHDSGKVTSSATTYAWTVPSSVKGVQLRWRVRLYDSDNKVGAYTSNQLFRSADPPQVQVLSPTENDAVPSASPLIYWRQAVTGAGGYIARFRLTISERGATAPFYDPGYRSLSVSQGSQTTFAYQIEDSILKNGRAYTLTLVLEDSNGLSNTATVNIFFARWNAPKPITFGVDPSQYSGSGYVELMWDASSKDPSFVRYNVYHRVVGQPDWEFIGTTSQIAEIYQYRDYTMGSGRTYEHAVTQVAVKFGEEVESYRPGENRVFNNSFEAGLGGWTITGGGARLTSDRAPGGGVACVEVIDNSTTNISTVHQDDNSLAGDMSFFVTDGERLRVEVDVKKITSTGNPAVSIFDDSPFIFTDLTQSQWAHKTVEVEIDSTRSSANVSASPTLDAAITGTARFDNFKVYSLTDPVSVEASDYWLVDPTGSRSVRLMHVTGEDFTEEYEEEGIVLIGRGRKYDYGTRLGFSGTLTAQLWDTPEATAREQRLQLELMKRERHTLFLKNPFGDVLAVNAGNIQFTRLAGVGSREFGTVSIPYQEIIT